MVCAPTPSSSRNHLSSLCHRERQTLTFPNGRRVTSAWTKSPETTRTLDMVRLWEIHSSFSSCQTEPLMVWIKISTFFADVLCEEGKTALEKLLKFMVHPAISSINLTTALGSLATIARQRPMFMSEVVQAYETLHGKCSWGSACRDDNLTPQIRSF